MKRISALALLIVASLSTASLAVAQDRILKAHIPFDFTVGDTWMPAGEYTISSPLNLMIQFRSADGHSATTVAAARSYHESNSGSKLVFSKYGDRYFLNRVLCPQIAALNLDVPASKAEKRSRSLEAAVHGSEETLIAAK
jgi:hypothetical protein